MSWLALAVLSAFFAGITSVLGKCGIRTIDSDVATALRTMVVLIFSWVMVFLVGSQASLAYITKNDVVFLVLSGLATGASWLCYFKALALGDVNKVVAVDKSSTVLSVLLAMVLLGETNHWQIKLVATFFIGLGTMLMLQKKKQETRSTSSSWLVYAIGSAVCAALTSILAKFGMSHIESNLATAIRTSVVLVMAWVIVFIKGKQTSIHHISKKEVFFLILSGITTGASWLCFYYALKQGVVSVVVPIDKLSIVVSVIFSYIVFHETLSKKALIGLGFMVLGTLVMTLC